MANSCLSLQLTIPGPSRVSTNLGSATITISANASANTIQFEACSAIPSDCLANVGWYAVFSTQNSSSSSTQASSSTGTGWWQFSIGSFTYLRARCSTFVAGSTTVTIATSPASAKAGGGGGGAGTVTSVSGTANQIDVATGTTTPVISVDSTFLFPGTFGYSSLGTGTLNAIGTTPTDSNLLTNTTAAAAGAQQFSPALHMEGQGWKTNATAASQAVDFRWYVIPVQGAANPTGNWQLESSINGAAYANPLQYSSAGNLNIPPAGAYQQNAVTILSVKGGTGAGSNVTVGESAGSWTVPADGVAVGRNACSATNANDVTCIGFNAGTTGTQNSTGNNVTLIGSKTAVALAADTNETVIGEATTGAGSNTATIGNASVTDIHFGGATDAAVVHGKGFQTTDSNNFGANILNSFAPCETNEAPTTLATGATTTQTGLSCLPAGSVIDAVVARVTTTITAACTGWELGDGTTAARFTSNNTGLAAGTVSDAAHIGTFITSGIASATTGIWQASATKITITCAGGNPGAGAIRIGVFYHQATAPTS